MSEWETERDRKAAWAGVLKMAKKAGAIVGSEERWREVRPGAKAEERERGT